MVTNAQIKSRLVSTFTIKFLLEMEIYVSRGFIFHDVSNMYF